MKKSAFNKVDCEDFITRIEQLTPETKALWGKMNVSKMLAHCNVTYEFLYDDIHPKPNPIMKLILKLFVKKLVVSDKAYRPNNPTAPQFIITDEKEFENEKTRLINYIRKTQELGETYFNGKESHSFGVLNTTEWNNMFIKHLDHHFKQFGV